MYLARTPALIKPLFKGRMWNVPGPGKDLYLTFDDGPIPEVTPWVLDILASRGAKATFFVIGRNATDHPSLLDRIRKEGHGLGNHTWDHRNGWKTPAFAYLRSVMRCQAIGLKHIRWAEGSAQLDAVARTELDALGERLTVNPGVSIEVGVHSDARGDAAEQLKLTQKRADAVVAYLKGKGIPKERLTARG